MVSEGVDTGRIHKQQNVDGGILLCVVLPGCNADTRRLKARSKKAGTVFKHRVFRAELKGSRVPYGYWQTRELPDVI